MKVPSARSKQEMLVTEIAHIAEDGIDPADALTPMEALARVLVLARGYETVEDGYGSGAISSLLAWGHGDRSLRAGLEEAGVVSSWE